MAADTGIPLLPPEEAIDFLRAKGFQVGFAWQDVWQEEHARAFTVAKAMNRDLLETIRQGVDDAIAEGETLAQFRAKLTPLLQAKGWWGRARMRDPATGEMKLVQLGSPRRLKIIYDMNLRMARAAGRWAKIQRTKDAFPYLRYTAVMDERTRPEHAEWHGTILPVDDPWWDTHYPPCGWNCRCTVIQLDDDMIRGRGWAVSGSPPPPGDAASYVNPRTGEVSDLPAGIDPGFAYNVGKAWLGGLEPPPLLPPDLPALEPGVEPGAPAPGAPSPAELLPADVAPEAAAEAFLGAIGESPPTPPPVAHITGTEVAPAGAPIEVVREGARASLLDRRGAALANPRLGPVAITRRGIREMSSASYERFGGAAKLRVTPAVPDVIARGTVTTEPNLKPESKPQVRRIARVTAPVEVGGERQVVEVQLERHGGGWQYYNHRIVTRDGRPVHSGGALASGGQGSADVRSGPKAGSRPVRDIGSTAGGVEDRVIIDAGGWPLAIGTGWFRGADGAARVPAGDRRRVLGLVGRAIAAPSEIRWRWVTGADGTPMLFRRYIARIDGLAIVVDVGRAGWRFATERDPGFDLARLATGTLAWSAKP